MMMCVNLVSLVCDELKCLYACYLAVCLFAASEYLNFVSFFLNR